MFNLNIHLAFIVFGNAVAEKSHFNSILTVQFCSDFNG